MMKRQLRPFTWILIITGMAMIMSCNLPFPPNRLPEQSGDISTYPTVSALLTEMAKGPVVTLGLPEETKKRSTEEVELVETPSLSTNQVEIIVTEQPSNSQQISVPCNLAQAGNPIDISIPDDTRMHPGEYFSKTWRLVNAGSCTWDHTYGIVWFSGDALGLSSTQMFGSDIMPGGSVEVSVEMIAPLNPGTYQSNWKLLDNQGDLFGIGPEGNAPFWARIVVVPVATPTATPTWPLATPTAVIYASGALALALDQPVDLDSGLVEQGIDNDLFWTKSSAGNPVLSPDNGARFFLYGMEVPYIDDCVTALLNTDPVDPAQIQEGSYLCYRTTDGLPGRIFVEQTDLIENEMHIEYLTWVVP